MTSPLELPVVSAWFSLTWATARVAMLTEPHVDELLRANLWYVRGRERDLLVDAGNGVAPLRPVLERWTSGRDRETVALATHAHSDHIGGLHEFERRLLHPREEAAALAVSEIAPLVTADWPSELKAQLTAAGLPPAPVLVDARPAPDFDPSTFRVAPVTATHFVEGGDIVDLGDRQLQVVHLPGHTPGGIGLWDEVEQALFCGDTIYDAELIDTLPESNVEDYVKTMRLLRELPAVVVYPGHDRPFGGERLRELADAYLRRRDG